MRLAALVSALLAFAAAGCGTDDAQNLADDVRERAGQVRDRAERIADRADEIRAEAEKVGGRVARRVRETLEKIEQAVPRAGPGTEAPQTRGRTETGTIDAFLTDVLESVDDYWTKTLAASDLPEPRVRYAWIPPGRASRSACGETAGDRAAFFCPADDTIYVGQRLASEVYEGVIRGLPGESSGGRAVGDFGVAYLVAHEYAHNLQQELGLFAARPGSIVKPFELQADCMAGLWGNSVYRAGGLAEGDVQEAISTVLAVGDFETRDANHHGTPEERRDAWLLGFESGDPAVCRHFVQA
jgi:predicted metalloprotease